MKLLRVLLKDLGVYRGAHTFDLDPAFTVLLGENASGKTTLARAIYFAITGKLPRTGLKAAGLAAPGTETGTVALVLERDGVRFRVIRSTGGDAQAARREGSEWAPCALAEALPPIPPARWNVACFQWEDDLGAFLASTPADRREVLEHVVGAGPMQAALEALKKARRLAKRQYQQATVRLAGLDAAAGQKVEALRQDVAAARARLAAAELAAATGGEEEVLAQVARLQRELVAIADGADAAAALERALAQAQAATAALPGLAEQVSAAAAGHASAEAQHRQWEDIAARLMGIAGREACPTCEQPISSSYAHHLGERHRAAQTGVRGALEAAYASLEAARTELRAAEEAAAALPGLAASHARWCELTRELAELEARTRGSEGADGDQQARGTAEALEASREALVEAERALAQAEQRAAAFEEGRRAVRQAARAKGLAEWVVDATEDVVGELVGAPLGAAEAAVATAIQNIGLFAGRPQAIALEPSALMPELDGREWARLSGSERALAYLVTKVALAELVAGPEFLVLDDPTLHLDEVRCARLAEYLAQCGRQVVVLTSDRRFEAACPSELGRIILADKAAGQPI